MPGMFGMSCACALTASRTHTITSAAENGEVGRALSGSPTRTRHGSRHRKTKSALTDDNPTAETVVFVVDRVVVELTRACGRQRTGRAALARRQEADAVDLRAIAMIRIGTTLDVVGDVVVVDERHASAHADVRLVRQQTKWRDRHARRERWRS